MDIIEKFRQLIDEYDETPESTHVDISRLLNEFRSVTPIRLPYLNTPSTFNDMPYVILHNFCNSCQSISYPLSGLRALVAIAAKSVDEEDTDVDNTKLRMILLVHISKLRIKVIDSSAFIGNFESMNQVNEDPETALWLDVARQTLINADLNDLIDEMIKDTFGQCYAARVSETRSIPVSIVLVTTGESRLRGFSGINQVVINRAYFRVEKTKLVESGMVEQDNVLLIDVATVCIHEYAHIRTRQVMEDFNLSTPNAILKTADNSDAEFGHMVEKKLFNCAIDWMLSLQAKAVSQEYVTRFLKAVQDDKVLPRLSSNPSLMKRGASALMYGGGIDIVHGELVLE